MCLLYAPLMVVAVAIDQITGAVDFNREMPSVLSGMTTTLTVVAGEFRSRRRLQRLDKSIVAKRCYQKLVGCRVGRCGVAGRLPS